MCSPWFPRSGLPVDASLSSTGSSRASSPASTVLSKRYDSLPPIPPRFVAFAWRYLGVTRWFRSSADECTVEAWSWSPGSSSRDLTEETTGPPKFLGNLNCPFAMFQTDAGRTACTRPIQCSSVALGISKAKAPTKGLSTLNSMAFGLAIYASQCGLPQPHARLASGRWSGATGRAFHPQDSAERFQICFLHLILLSQASWHNEIDRCVQVVCGFAVRSALAEALSVWVPEWVGQMKSVYFGSLDQQTEIAAWPFLKGERDPVHSPCKGRE